jgi:Zn-dependent metalloprotease
LKLKKYLLALAFFSLNSFSLITTQENSQQKIPTLNTVSVDEFGTSSKSINTPNIFELNEKQKNLLQEGANRRTQFFKGIQVYGSQVVYHVENGNIIHRSGRVTTIDENLDTIELISKDEVRIIAAQVYPDLKKFAITKIIYPLANQNHLAWHLVEESFSRKLEIFIDAHSGEVIDQFNNINTGIGIGLKGRVRRLSTSRGEDGGYVLKSRKAPFFQTFTMNENQNRYELPGELFQQKVSFWRDQAATDAHYYAGFFLKVLRKSFNRNSYDDKGATVTSSVHYGKDYVNAFWNGSQMVYGDGDGKMSTHLSGGLDVIAHEISHAITSSTSRLIYRSESGALNESFSDIMGAYAEYAFNKRTFDWLVGEDIWTPGIKGDALRYTQMI